MLLQFRFFIWPEFAVYNMYYVHVIVSGGRSKRITLTVERTVLIIQLSFLLNRFDPISHMFFKMEFSKAIIREIASLLDDGVYWRASLLFHLYQSTTLDLFFSFSFIFSFQSQPSNSLPLRVFYYSLSTVVLSYTM